MKLRKFLGLFLCTLLVSSAFIACSSDDDEIPEEKHPVTIFGTWKYDKKEALVEVKDPEIEKAVTDAILGLDLGESNIYVFSVDGKFKFKEALEAEEVAGTYTVDGEKLTLTSGEDSNTVTFKSDTIYVSNDVKSIVAKQLDIDETEIVKAIKVNGFGEMTR
ncbi:hypothetical protein [Dysgonomonas sp. BGC7]|uniref:hypothetical protein n=1 Tax=Dysgonomonas sp. BGC7 TaxID=1658008 RepID=UPI000680C6F0|nr:hypothetical protein [Dysgonomonas sp. BGC7]MBD8387731.1 hypothetical protein [Dysgonomonas sp. BGC7]